MEFTPQRRETFLFLTTNMAVVMSRANQQWTKEREKGKINFARVQCKGIQIPESGKYLLVESGIQAKES